MIGGRYPEDEDGNLTDDSFDTVNELRYSARERAYRRRLRRDLRRERREEKRNKGATADWDLYFCWQSPTAWRAGMKAGSTLILSIFSGFSFFASCLDLQPTQYGQRLPFERPKDY